MTVTKHFRFQIYFLCTDGYFRSVEMDSFYGAPRQPPTPPAINTAARIPTVPEVSVIDNLFCPQSKCFKPPTMKLLDKSSNRDAFHQDPLTCNSSLYKKQVRFKSSAPEMNFGKENVPTTLKTVPDLNGKTFKQIYMANVPDRHLDLSIFEPPQQKETNLNRNCDLINSNKQISNLVSESVKEKSFSVSPPLCNNGPSHDITQLKNVENRMVGSNYGDRISNFSTSRNSESVLKLQERYSGGYRSRTLPKCTEICTQTEPESSNKCCTEIATSSDEPTIKDLYRIIQQQNEQIMLLQRQVNSLKTTIRQPEIDSMAQDHPIDKPFMQEFNSPTKKSLFSIDVKATNFEFSFRPQHKFRKNDFLEPKIQEIVDNTDNQNQSLHLDESIDVRDNYVSNVKSIAIEMENYGSLSSDDDEEPEIGLTFYKGLMSQVHKALKKTHKQSECQTAANKCQDMKGQAMKAVQQATLQHLKNIGVNLSPIQESSEVTGESDLDLDTCNPSEISCAVQQLLMKYLSPDKLAKIAKKPQAPPKLREKKVKPTNTEFSFATLQYMEKYNLINNNRISHEREKRLPEATPKVLNVTSLKQQPKLV